MKSATDANSSDVSFINKIWNLLISVKLTIVVLIALAATSAVGTVIPQNKSLAAYYQEYGETLFRIFYSLDLFDMYHSWWFLFLLLLLTLNVAFCSLNRFSATWRIISANPPPFSVSRFRKVGKQV